MENIIAAIRLQEIDTSLVDDPQILLTFNKKKETARHYVASMILSVGGRELGNHESDIIVEVPLDSANIIRNLHAKVKEDLELSTTIGVGDTLDEAKQALEWAIKHMDGTIKVMEPNMKELEGSASEETSNNDAPDDLAIDEQGPSLAMVKAEKVDDYADAQESISDEMKQKIGKIIEMLRTNKEYIDSLKQKSPELYNGVHELVNSISSMVQAAKMEDVDKHAKMMTKVARFLEAAENKHLDKESSDILEHLIEAQEDHKQQKAMEGSIRHKKAETRFRTRRKMARDHAAKTGADPEFIMKLNRMLRD